MLTKQEIIEQSPLCSSIDSGDCAVLSDITELVHLHNNEYLVHEGDDDANLYLVVDGALDVIKSIGEEEEILHRLAKNELAGIFGFGGDPRLAGLKARGESVVLRMNKQDFEGLIESRPRLVYKVMAALIHASQEIVRHLDSNQIELHNFIRHSHGRY